MAFLGRGRRAGGSNSGRSGGSPNSLDAAARPGTMAHSVLGRQFANRAHWQEEARPGGGYFGGSGGSSNVGRAVATGMVMHHTINGT